MDKLTSMWVVVGQTSYMENGLFLSAMSPKTYNISHMWQTIFREQQC